MCIRDRCLPFLHTLIYEIYFSLISYIYVFTNKSVQEIERSLRAHRGALTKITCYIDTALNAATIMPTEKGCRVLEQLKERMEIKTEEM